MAKNSKPQIIWQWNCRGYRTKRSNLQAFLTTLDETPLLIALQETHTPTKLLNYRAHQDTRFPQLSTLVHRNTATQQHRLNSDIPHVFITLLPPKPTSTYLHVLNVYSPPKSTYTNFKALFQQAIHHSKAQPLLILGDFNAPPERVEYYGKLYRNSNSQCITTLNSPPD